MGLLERSWDVETRIPNSLLQLSPVTQLELKQDKVKYEPKLAASDTDAYESSASLERRMRDQLTRITKRTQLGLELRTATDRERQPRSRQAES